MNGKLSPSRVDILRMLIIYEPAILAKVKILNGKSNERPKTVEVMENGQVILYYGSGPKWLQKFFNAYGLVSITDIAIELADTMSGTGEARNEEAFYGIMSAVLKEAKDNKDLDCIVDILFDSVRNSSNGELHSKYINEKYLQKYVKEKKVRDRSVGISETGNETYIGIRTSDGRILPCYFGKEIKIVNRELQC